MALVRPGLRVEHDDAMIEVTIGDVELAGLLVDEEPRRPSEIVAVVAAAVLAGVPDLQQELSLGRELEDMVVFLRAAAQPDVVVAVDEDAVRRASRPSGDDLEPLLRQIALTAAP